MWVLEYWFRLFKSGDFNLKDKERLGQPKKFEDAELQAKYWIKTQLERLKN